MSDEELRPDEISDADIEEILQTLEKTGVMRPTEELADFTVCLNGFIKKRILSIGDAKHILSHGAAISVSSLKSNGRPDGE